MVSAYNVTPAENPPLPRFELTPRLESGLQVERVTNCTISASNVLQPGKKPLIPLSQLANSLTQPTSSHCRDSNPLRGSD